MPYIKKQPHKMTMLLRAYGLDGVTLAAVLECCPNTALKRIKDPTTLTVGELGKISRRAHIPIEEIRGAL